MWCPEGAGGKGWLVSGTAPEGSLTSTWKCHTGASADLWRALPVARTCGQGTTRPQNVWDGEWPVPEDTSPRRGAAGGHFPASREL